MQYHLLRESPPNSGIFEMTGETLDASPEQAVAACADRTAADGVRTGLWPYDAVRRDPAPAPEPAAPEMAEDPAA